LGRELIALKDEQTQHVNRIKGLLASQGLDVKVDENFPERLAALRRPRVPQFARRPLGEPSNALQSAAAFPSPTVLCCKMFRRRAWRQKWGLSLTQVLVLRALDPIPRATARQLASDGQQSQ
jgi:hypothetical protein